ncbi:unnamed protein product [Candidula unifasciata]|uniref:Solute carrier family 46 member 3 n=1 Tax=Candidula unifasciata TaxID=100452 RepID=A0A8S3ZSM0_9EUPU|nr:unnamed protein product [Candidula unifasciata]
MSVQVDANDTEKSNRVAPEHQHGPVSVLKVRIISAVVPVFSLSASSARDSIVAQYLVDRLANDQGYLNLTDVASCSGDANSSVLATANDIQSQASDLQTYYSYAQCVPAIFICLFIGSYSDYLGRRFLLLLPLFTVLVKMIITTCIIRFHLDLRFMYLAYGFDGLSGSWYALLMAMFALTADICTKESDRSFWIFFTSFSSAIVNAVLNIVGGYLISNYGFTEASILLSCMLAVSFFIPLFFLPETHLHRPKTKEYNPLVHMRRIFGFYFFDGSPRRKATFCLGILIFIIAVSYLIYQASLDALYQMHQPFCWDANQIGYYSSARGAGAFVAGAVILKILQKCMADKYIAMLGLLCQGGSLIFQAFVWESWQFYLVPAIGAPGTSVTAIVRALLSLQTGPDKQGALFSSIAVVEAVVGLASAAAWYQIYSSTVGFMPGFVYVTMAACCFLSFVLFIIYNRIQVTPTIFQHVVLSNPLESE